MVLHSRSGKWDVEAVEMLLVLLRYLQYAAFRSDENCWFMKEVCQDLFFTHALYLIGNSISAGF